VVVFPFFFFVPSLFLCFFLPAFYLRDQGGELRVGDGMGKRKNGEYGRVCGIPSAAVFFNNLFVDFIHKHTQTYEQMNGWHIPRKRRR
jgi:hypothetical protein